MRERVDCDAKENDETDFDQELDLLLVVETGLDGLHVYVDARILTTSAAMLRVRSSSNLRPIN